MDVNPQISCTSLDCKAEDQAGNRSVLSFKQIKFFNTYFLVLSKISYNEVSASLVENLFTVGLTGKTLQNSTQATLIKRQQVAGIAFDYAKNLSKVIDLQSGGALQTYVLNGLHLIKLKTNKQNINVKIE